MQEIRRRVGGFVHASRTWRLGVLAGAAMAMLVAVQLPASAALSDPYVTGSTGFDISYPNCSTTLPGGDSFAIVGVGGGRPFTANSCVGSEWSAADAATGAPPSAYFNTGYSGAYRRDIAATCTSAVSSASATGVFSSLSRHALSQAEQAWEIGCSEAAYASALAPGAPTMWWADIETGNSWSTNPSLNDFAIDGISYEMAALGAGGIYSSPAMWASITGSSSWEPTPGVAAHWVIGGTCAATFGSAPTWLSQGPAANGIDADTAC